LLKELTSCVYKVQVVVITFVSVECRE